MAWPLGALEYLRVPEPTGRGGIITILFTLQG